MRMHSYASSPKFRHTVVEEHCDLAVKVDPRGRLERSQERMLARVTTIPVRTWDAENPRFPQQ